MQAALKGRPFTPAEDKILKQNFDKINAAEIGRMIGRSKGTVRQRYKKLGLVVPADVSEKFRQSTKFKNGHRPWSYGKKQEEMLTPAQIEALKKHRFKKGHASHNKAEEGAIRFVRMSGKNSPLKYYNVKINGVWVFLHHHLWVQHNGEIPPGMVVAFKDGNQLNCVIDNLELITRKDNMMRNTIHRYPQEVKASIYAISSLKKKIKQHEK